MEVKADSKLGISGGAGQVFSVGESNYLWRGR